LQGKDGRFLISHTWFLRLDLIVRYNVFARNEIPVFSSAKGTPVLVKDARGYPDKSG